MASTNPNPSHGAEPLGGWAELPRDVMSAIFKKAGPIAVLTGAQFVCRPWRRASFDPSIWRRIDMADFDLELVPIGLGNFDKQRLVRDAIDRAQGHVEEFSAAEDLAASDPLLSYLANRNSHLRRIRLIAPGVLDYGLAAALRGSPLLEEIEVTYGLFHVRLFKVVKEACPGLRRFRCVHRSGGMISYPANDEFAFRIAEYMPQLRRLQLVGSTITDAGLMAILDRCVHLESLDISLRPGTCLDESILEKCARIKDVNLPEASAADSQTDSGHEQFMLPVRTSINAYHQMLFASKN